MDTYGPPAPNATDLVGRLILNQEEQADKRRRMALATALMGTKGTEMPKGSGAFGGFMSGLSGLGDAMLLGSEIGDMNKRSSAPAPGSLWSKGFGEASFGPDKIGLRDGIRGMFGLPK